MKTIDYEQAVDNYADMVLRIAFANMNQMADAQDVMQDVFLKLYSQDSFEDENHLKHWLIRVTVNRCKDIHRLFYRKHASLDTDYMWVPNKENIDVMEILASLSKEERTYLYLHYVLGYTYGEIGEILNKNTNTVSSKARRAISKLQIEQEGLK